MNAPTALNCLGLAFMITLIGTRVFHKRWEKALLLSWLVLFIAALSINSAHAAEREKPSDWADWSPPGFAKAASPWQFLGSNERGLYYLSTYDSPMLGKTFTLKQVVRGLSGNVVGITLDDFTVGCGPHGEPPDVVGSVGTVAFDPRTSEILAQVRSDLMTGTPLTPVPGSVLARATIVACYARKSR